MAKGRISPGGCSPHRVVRRLGRFVPTPSGVARPARSGDVAVGAGAARSGRRCVGGPDCCLVRRLRVDTHYRAQGDRPRDFGLSIGAPRCDVRHASRGTRNHQPLETRLGAEEERRPHRQRLRVPEGRGRRAHGVARRQGEPGTTFTTFSTFPRRGHGNCPRESRPRGLGPVSQSAHPRAAKGGEVAKVVRPRGSPAEPPSSRQRHLLARSHRVRQPAR